MLSKFGLQLIKCYVSNVFFLNQGVCVMLEISPEKVAFVIMKAKEFEANTESWDEAPSITDTSLSADEVLESRTSDAARSEAADFIAGLNEDEQANLVALAWLGRGTYSVDDFDEAVATANTERSIPTADYLLGIPLLAEYLEEGLEKLGYSVEAIEKDVP
jgi:hypothetical protein